MAKVGLLELVVACEALTEALNDTGLGLALNHRTGTHVHIGWLADDSGVARAIELTHLLEPLLRTLVHPSRFPAYDEHEKRYDTQRPNPYCLPVSSVYPVGDLDDATTLVHSVVPSPVRLKLATRRRPCKRTRRTIFARRRTG